MQALNGTINTAQNKKNQLIDLLLDSKIDKIEYDKRFNKLELQIVELKVAEQELENSSDIGISLEERLETFKEIFDTRESMTSFSAEIFRLIIEKVVVGGFDKDGKPLPYTLNFIFKTGLEVNISPLFTVNISHKAPDERGMRDSDDMRLLRVLDR